MEKNHLKVFHIAGITDIYKQEFINKIKALKMYVIYDLDEETEKIYKLKELTSKIKEFESAKPLTKKKLDIEIANLWKKHLNEFIKKIIANNQHLFGIIFIGNIFPIFKINVNDKNIPKFNLKNKLVIDTIQTFFLKVAIKDNAQEIIKFNLKKYHDDIVNGIFPLNYINLEFLINYRETLQNVYKKLHYDIYPLEKIVYYFQYGIHEKKPEILYVFLPEEHHKFINAEVPVKKIYGFTEDWLALTSIATGIERGYENGIAFIKEKTKGSFNKLEQSGYVYVVASTNFLPAEKSNIKFMTEKKIKILKHLKIDNVFVKLKDLKIKII